ncbi:antA/AntB antirepressor family protein [Empedobacter tilapiae]|uniref:antA/AntB antirepressor family protein n=1 Tax=Empedobacter tilapiae TaxID=2491114 RepID=UPI0028D6A5FB|nr:antA/AntB antirepressor family protein [Empedobacter tilapiae]
MEKNTTERFELIKINQSNNGEQIISARELHEFLKSKQDFSTWIKKELKHMDLSKTKILRSID